MIRHNLSTRPFYNERAVHAALAVLAAALVVVTVLNVSAIAGLSERHTALVAQAAGHEARAAGLDRETAALRSQIDAAALRAAVDATSEANSLIDRRTFSWTELFNHLEATLPPDVMLMSVRPEVRDGRVWITMTAVGRSVGSLGTFVDRLEETGAFTDVLSRQEEAHRAGTYRATLRGAYLAARDSGVAAPDGEAPPEESGGDGGPGVPPRDQIAWRAGRS